jgi:branched-chain amino acid aminotransferase
MSVTELASIDGLIAPTAQSTIPLKDDGLYRGDGAFEVIRLYSGRPFALAEHLDRLERSAAVIELEVARDELESEIAALLERHGDADAQLRLLITRGGRRIAAIEPLAAWGETVRLATVTYKTTSILDGVKSLSYAANMHATRIARGRGADEALLVRPDGVVLEAPTSAIFWTTDGGELRTPALEAGILDSITRRVVCERFDVVEGEFDIEDALGAREAFLASTTREIQAVAAIDDRELQSGPHATAASESLAEAVAEALGSAAR